MIWKREFNRSWELNKILLSLNCSVNFSLPNFCNHYRLMLKLMQVVRVFPRPFRHWGGGLVQGEKVLIGGLMRGNIDIMGDLTLIYLITNWKYLLLLLLLLLVCYWSYFSDSIVVALINISIKTVKFASLNLLCFYIISISKNCCHDTTMGGGIIF